MFRNLEPLEVTDEVLMLEHRDVSGDFSIEMRDGGLTGPGPDFFVMMQVNLNRKLAKPEQVARCYEKVLAAEGVKRTSWEATDFSSHYYRTSLHLKVMSNRLPNVPWRSLNHLPFHPAYLYEHSTITEMS